MQKGSGTRSGLLWEVERILNECKDIDCLPQVLIMENVPAVCGSKNLKPWNDWLDSLEKIGYTNYHKILNAKDCGIPQSRQRCFMVSILGQYSFSFPRKMPLKYRLKDFIKKNVDDKYYLSNNLVKMYQEYTIRNKNNGNGFAFKPTDGSKTSASILTRSGDRPCDNFILASIDTYNKTTHINPLVSETIQTRHDVPNHGERIIVEGNYSPSGHSAASIVDKNGVAPTVMENHGTITSIVEGEDKK